jgi:hypothetical protein
VHEALSITTARDGLVLDVPAVLVTGYVTQNGANPSRACNWHDSVIGHVRFEDSSRGYTLDQQIRCDAHQNRHAFGLFVFPGTYRVLAAGERDATSLPAAFFAVNEAVQLNAARDGLVLDVPTVRVTGYVTQSGANPSRRCDWHDSVIGQVRFVEAAKGYEITHLIRCDAHQSRHAFDQALFPGVWEVSARGQAGATDLPAAYYVVHDTLSITTARDGLVLDVPVVGVKGYVTLDGAHPSRSCDYHDSPLGQVRFREIARGYELVHTIRCDGHQSRHAFDQLVFPGTYEISTKGQPGATNLPDAFFVAQRALAIAAPRDGLVLDVPTVEVAGYVTLGGEYPSRNCPYHDSVLGYLRLVELREGHQLTHPIRCNDHPTRPAFRVRAFPGTYRIEARGQEGASSLPSTFYAPYAALDLR